MQQLVNLQFTMFTMIAAGVILKKVGIIGEEGKNNLTDLVIFLILPSNIIRSFMVEFSMKILCTFAGVLSISILIQVVCSLLGHILYNKMEPSKKKCLRYGTICSNAGFLGNPVAEGVFGTMGLTLASIYLIPQRIVMWSAGISVFTESPSKKALVKKVLTHPCIIACMVGILLLVSQLQLPGFLTETITALSSCNTALSMMVIGLILADINVKSMLDKRVLYYTLIRLVLIPVLVYIPCELLRVDPLVTGVCVLLAAMPAGATTSILASKYNGDAEFATNMVIVSTLASLVTTPVWSAILL
ncbi:MAG TPA: AEC family transporter [Clostridiales bacterium]|nr:AEC family transporter [Clostridiales bacterium]